MSYQKSESYAKWGDDVFVWEYFGQKSDGVVLEAGANHPTIHSQTYLLEKRGWKRVLVEPIPECCNSLREHRPGSQIFQNALGAPAQRGRPRFVIPRGLTELAYVVGEGYSTRENDECFEAELMTLTEVLEAAGIKHLDFLSLDLEGMELEALHGLDLERFRPGLIIIEDRLHNLSRHRFLKKSRYKLVWRNGSNNWYIPLGHLFKVSVGTRLGLFRKLRLSMPFRSLRSFSGRLRKKGTRPHGR